MNPLKRALVHAAVSATVFVILIAVSLLVGSTQSAGKIAWFLSWPFAAYAALQLFVLVPVYMIRNKKAQELLDLDIQENKKEADIQLAKVYRESIYPLLAKNNAVAVLLCRYKSGMPLLVKNQIYAVLASNNNLIFVSQDPDEVMLILRFSDIEDITYELTESYDLPIRTTTTTRYLNIQEIRYTVTIQYRSKNDTAETMQLLFPKIDTIHYPPDQLPNEYAYLVKHATPRALFNEAALSKCNLFSYLEDKIKPAGSPK